MREGSSMHIVRREHIYCWREKAAHMLYVKKKNEPCLLVEPGKWWSELEEANAHMLAHVFTSRCMHTRAGTLV